MSETRTLTEVAQDCVATFERHAAELADLRWEFWFALGAIHGAATFGDGHAVETVVRNHHRQLGAPGDFGYGTPCGDALRALYDAVTAFGKTTGATP